MGERSKLWLIRHGETQWSAMGRHTGRTDIPLAPSGGRQVEALGRHLAGRSFVLVLCSPLQRARETCRLAGYAAVATFTDDLLEWDYGAYEGRTTSEIRNEVHGWSIWTGGVPAGETAEQVGSRAERVITQALSVRGEVALFEIGRAHV